MKDQKKNMRLTTSSANLAFNSSSSGIGMAGVTAWRLRGPAPSTTQYVISGGSSFCRQPHHPRRFSLEATPSIFEAVSVLLLSLSLLLEFSVFSVLGRAENCAWRLLNFLARSGFGKLDTE